MTRAAAPKTPLAVLAAYLHEGVRHIWLGLEVLTLPSRWVESTIAASVILAALNNLRPLFANSRCQLAFLFGLVHGLGFANVLLALGLPTQSLAASLAGFNLGVELGQLMLMAMIFPLAYWLRHTVFYRQLVVKGGSLGIIAIASVWLVNRVTGLDIV